MFRLLSYSSKMLNMFCFIAFGTLCFLFSAHWALRGNGEGQNEGITYRWTRLSHLWLWYRGCCHVLQFLCVGDLRVACGGLTQDVFFLRNQMSLYNSNCTWQSFDPQCSKDSHFFLLLQFHIGYYFYYDFKEWFQYAARLPLQLT